MNKLIGKDGKLFSCGGKLIHAASAEEAPCVCGGKPEPCPSGSCIPPCAAFPVGHPLSCQTDIGDPCQFEPFDPDCCNGSRSITPGTSPYVFLFVKWQELRTQDAFPGFFQFRDFPAQSWIITPNPPPEFSFFLTCDTISGGTPALGTWSNDSGDGGEIKMTASAQGTGDSAGLFSALNIGNITGDPSGAYASPIAVSRSICNGEGIQFGGPEAVRASLDLQAGFSAGISWAIMRGSGTYSEGSGLSDSTWAWSIDVRSVIGPWGKPCPEAPDPCGPFDACPTWPGVIGDIAPPQGDPADPDITTPGEPCPGGCEKVSGVCVKRGTLQLPCGITPVSIPCAQFNPDGTTIRVAGENVCVKPSAPGSSMFVLCNPLDADGLCAKLHPSGPTPAPAIAPPSNLIQGSNMNCEGCGQ